MASPAHSDNLSTTAIPDGDDEHIQIISAITDIVPDVSEAIEGLNDMKEDVVGDVKEGIENVVDSVVSDAVGNIVDTKLEVF